MPDTLPSTAASPPPLPHVKSKRWLPSLIWLMPLAAAFVGLTLLFQAWRSEGPRVTISFRSAEGLEVNKTLLKYRNMTIGRVTALTLSADRARVLVTVDVAKSAEDIMTSDAQFWVVRPRIGVGWVSGLDTLISGAYIGVDGGYAKTPQRRFTGLEDPPPLTGGLSGKRIVLHTDDLGSVSYGAPVYFRHFQVGRVIDRQLGTDGTGASVSVFIDAPYDRFVTGATRFWNASGIDMAVGADGLTVKTESLAAVLAGGIAFEQAPIINDPVPAAAGAQFELFKNEAAAMAPPNGEPHYVRMRFSQSLRGLSIGAPVEFVGVNIGSVVSIDLDYVAKDESFPVIVTAVLYPHRMGRAYEGLVQEGTATSDEKMARLVGRLVARGLRAQARAANLLTGQLYLALDFIPGASLARFDPTVKPLEIPTAPGSIDEVQTRIASIVRKIDEAPLADIANHADLNLQDLHGLLQHLDRQVVPGTESTLDSLRKTLGVVDAALAEDSPGVGNLRQTLEEAQHTLRSIRSLTDYLDRHPESLIRGRQLQHLNESNTSAHTTGAPGP